MPLATDQWQARSGDAASVSMVTECMCIVSTSLVDACIISKHCCSRLHAEEVQTEHWPRVASRKPRPSQRNRDMMRYDLIGYSGGNAIASLDGARRSGQAEKEKKKAMTKDQKFTSQVENTAVEKWAGMAEKRMTRTT